MKTNFAVAILAALAFAFVSLAPAAAKDVRFPEQGNVAFMVQLPDDWASRTDSSGNFILSSSGAFGGISLSLIEGAAAVKMSYDDLAKEILVAAGAQPFSRHEPAAIGNVKGEAYFSRMKNASGVDLQLKLTIVKINGTHIASLTTVTILEMAPAQTKSLDTMVRGISLMGVK